jgi:transposase
MAGHYRPVDRDQVYLMPPSMAEWLPVEHPVWFVIEVVKDLEPELRRFRAREVLGGSGRAAYDPMMLVTLMAYALWQGVRSSRQIEVRCQTDVAFRIICAQDPPDHSTIARFRKAHAAAFEDLFTRILLLCARSGMGRFGKVAIDGTKIAANAAKAANVTVDSIRRVAEEEVAAGLAADADDPADDQAPPPSVLRDRTQRLQRVERVRQELEAEQARLDQGEADAQAKALEYVEQVRRTRRGGKRPKRADAIEVARARYERERARQQARIDEWEAERAKPLTERTRAYLGAPPQPVDQAAPVRCAREALEQAERDAVTKPAGSDRQQGRPGSAEPKQIKRNITDPDSRLMPTRDGFIQGYNVQAAVSEDHLITAIKVTNTPADVTQAVPMAEATDAAATMIAEHTGRDTTIGLKEYDAGYDSDANLEALGDTALIANAKRREHERVAATRPAQGPPPPGATPREAMDHRLRTPEGRAAYRRRGAIVEPVFGILKEALGIRRFLTRGTANVTGEVNLAAAVHNLRRLFNHIAQTAGAH